MTNAEEFFKKNYNHWKSFPEVALTIKLSQNAGSVWSLQNIQDPGLPGISTYCQYLIMINKSIIYTEYSKYTHTLASQSAPHRTFSIIDYWLHNQKLKSVLGLEKRALELSPAVGLAKVLADLAKVSARFRIE